MRKFFIRNDSVGHTALTQIAVVKTAADGTVGEPLVIGGGDHRELEVKEGEKVEIKEV